jgi:hypothetical protein
LLALRRASDKQLLGGFQIDAEKLARSARSDPEMLKPVQHPGANIPADMAVVNSRRALAEARTKLINPTGGLLMKA